MLCLKKYTGKCKAELLRETISERVKSNPQQKINRNMIENLTPNKLLTRLPILLAQIKD